MHQGLPDLLARSFFSVIKRPSVLSAAKTQLAVASYPGPLLHKCIAISRSLTTEP